MQLISHQKIYCMDIKAVINRQGYTMAQVAEKLGISQQAVSQAVNGNPSLSRLKEIAEAVGVTVSDLVVDEPPIEPMMKCPYCGKELKLTKAEEPTLQSSTNPKSQ